MMRDVVLRPLPRDHHHALVFARSLRTMSMAAHVDAAALTGVRARFTAEILPHFVLEETLLAGLGGRGVDDLVQRTRDEHRTMLRLIARATAADPAPLGELAKILVEHVRFKERELYPACEQRLDDDVLDRIAHAHRKAS